MTRCSSRAAGCLPSWVTNGRSSTGACSAAPRVRDPYVDVLSLAQVRALRIVRDEGDGLSEEARAKYLSLILATVTGVSAGLQNTG